MTHEATDPPGAEVHRAPELALPLRAGPLRLVFDRGGLRWIRLGEREVLRGIYVAVREEGWATVPAVLDDLEIEAEPEAFRIRFVARHRRAGVRFDWAGRIQGGTDGRITCSMDGAAASAFRRNRIGFCVLHPAESCAGRPCIVETVDGDRAASFFPSLVAPHQPFRNVRAILHEVAPGVEVEVRMEGETFETEDQRNWSDASFKTYGTPLHLPFPVEVAEGTRVSQSVTLRLFGVTSEPVRDAAATVPGALPKKRNSTEPVVVRVGKAAGFKRPALGLGGAGLGPLGEQDAERLRSIGLDHLRADLRLAEAGWEARLERASADAQAIGAPLELALFLPAEPLAVLRDLASRAAALRSRVACWLLFAPDGTTADAHAALAREALGAAFPAALFGGGTDGHFAELNRRRPARRGLDRMVFALVPQAHAFDDATLVENLGSLRSIADTARGFATGVPLGISPVTLRPRVDPRPAGAREGGRAAVHRRPPAGDAVRGGVDARLPRRRRRGRVRHAHLLRAVRPARGHGVGRAVPGVPRARRRRGPARRGGRAGPLAAARAGPHSGAARRNPHAPLSRQRHRRPAPRAPRGASCRPAARGSRPGRAGRGGGGRDRARPPRDRPAGRGHRLLKASLPPVPSSNRRHLGEAALAVTSVAVFLLLAEAAARVLSLGVEGPTGYAPVNTRRREGRPTNSLGYRDVERAPEKPAGSRRVLSLGDSFAWGVGIEHDDTYARRVERALGRRPGERWEVVQLARPGMGTVEQAEQLAEEGFAYGPDVVVLGFVLNDSEDENAAEVRRARDWEETRRERQQRRVGGRLVDRSALWRFVAGRLEATGQNRRRLEAYRSQFLPGYPGWVACRQALARMGALCRERNVPFVVMIFPLFADPLDERYPFADLHAQVAQAAREAGAVVVDLLPAYRGLRSSLLVVDGAHDEHPNEIAHRIAAQELLRTLDRVLPPGSR